MHTIAPLAAVAAGTLLVPVFGVALPAQAAAGYTVTVTCKVPPRQAERQLASDSCLNYIPDGTQTFTAQVRKADGTAASGMTVHWTDSARNAHFRLAQNPCTTNASGSCSAELVVKRLRKGQKITVTATAEGASDQGYLDLPLTGAASPICWAPYAKRINHRYHSARRLAGNNPDELHRR